MTSFIIAICALWACRYIIEKTSFRLVALPTAIIGTPIHEFGHYVMCKLFGFKIEQVCWFRVPTRDNHNFGYVTYLYPRTPVALIQNILVSIGPLFTGFFTIWVLTPFLEIIFIDPSTNQWQISRVKNITWSDALIIWCLCSVSLHMLPSKADVKGAIGGSVIVGTIIYLLLSGGMLTGMRLTTWVNDALPQLTNMLKTSLFLLAPIVVIAINGALISKLMIKVDNQN